MNQQIPKILHQTWKTIEIPEYFQTLALTWKKYHPDWEYILWTDKMNRSFIKNNYPEFIERYDSYPNNIQRVDAVRYFILYHYGGLFVDIDVECFKPIDDLIDHNKCLFAFEPKEHALRFNMAQIVCNAFMGCKINAPFFKRICQGLMEMQIPVRNQKTDILNTTGPFYLTQVYDDYARKDQISILPSIYIYPLTISEIRLAMQGNSNSYIEKKIQDAYALHYFWGNWWQEIK